MSFSDTILASCLPVRVKRFVSDKMTSKRFVSDRMTSKRFLKFVRFHVESVRIIMQNIITLVQQSKTHDILCAYD